MKLSEIDEAGTLATKDQLEVALGRLENRIDSRFNSVDAKINGFDARLNTIQRSIWLLVVVALGQVCATFGPLVWKLYHP